MAHQKRRYLIDDQGKKTAVLLDLREYRKILRQLEELESIRAYDAAKLSADEAIPFEDAIRQIEESRK